MKGPASHPPAPNANVIMPIVMNGSSPKAGLILFSISGFEEIYETPPTNAVMAQATDATRLMRLRTLRSCRNRFHVRACCVLAVPDWGGGAATVDSERTCTRTVRTEGAILDLVLEETVFKWNVLRYRRSNCTVREDTRKLLPGLCNARQALLSGYRVHNIGISVR
jgi:hypothetical protein